MLDVHAPHEKIHGFWDFSLHLFTITIGLLIALSLEGAVEWHHHRTLVRDAEAAMHGEIEENLAGLPAIRQKEKDLSKTLDQDTAALDILRHDPKATPHMAMGFSFVQLDDLAWRTAQTTGAVSYMPYKDAEQFSDIYWAQDGVNKAQQQLVEESIEAVAPLGDLFSKHQMSPQQIDAMTSHIGVLRMRLRFLDSYLDTLEKLYRDYQAQHSGK
jgi:hypothetical protein